ncbi:MAG: MFS transporter [Egibacteraceae bacterium]
MLPAITFGLGAGEALSRPAFRALIPRVVGEANTQTANSLFALTSWNSAIIGPGLGGLLVATAGVRSTLLLDAATFAISMLTLLRVAEPPVVARPHPSAFHEALEGIQAVRERPWILAVMIMSLVQIVVAVAPARVLLPIVAREQLGGDAAYGIVLSLYAAGGLAAALLTARWRPREPGLVSMLSLVLLAGVSLALLFPLSLAWVGAWHAIGAFGVEIYVILWTTALQREVPEELLGRVMALDQLGALALLPLGFALSGPLIEVVPRAPLLLAGSAAVLLSVVGALAVPGVRRFSTPR